MKRYQISLLFLLLFIPTLLLSQVADPDPHRFDKEIENFVHWDKQNAWPADGILFAGSSSVRMWMSHDAFPDLPIINRGFGGAHISDVQFFIHKVILKYKPQIIIFYCGDNDIAGKKSPEQVLGDYKELVAAVQEILPKTHIIYVPIKPSIARWSMWPEMETTNNLVREFSETSPTLHYADIATPMLEKSSPPPADLFLEDGLHMTPKGYAIWDKVVGDLIKKYMK